jgi:hypothetical protein
VFFKDDANKVFHTYSTYGRGVEAMMGTYNMLDLTPEGRNERDSEYKMEWVRHHDCSMPSRISAAMDAFAADKCRRRDPSQEMRWWRNPL